MKLITVIMIMNSVSSIHPDLLRALVAVVEAGSFTAAARSLSLRQSTVSQQVRRLEEQVGRRLLLRDTHHLALTPEGSAFLDHARRVLDAYSRMERHLSGAPLRGRLRFGASEDFVLSALPDVLAAFARRHPEVDLAVTAGLSEDLYTDYDAGRLDIVMVKRRRGDTRGTTVWREKLAWVGRADFVLDPESPAPMLFYPPPSVTRALAIEALEQAGRSWRLAFTSANLSGLFAAARAGVGVMPHSARLLPESVSAIDREGLPALPEIEFVVLGPGGRHAVAEALTAAILQWARVPVRR
ncbi:LysR substrate-binding domain-containing protein [Novosphingobium sp. 9]|uniref:LysR substrate-binding domain-containing protein n=1 Tax=Novosphingobium sp. 9 TaxID=2025349 RepID=UPI0021B530F7|nr:LysR substrate-binding domain-containing protein [Novosphingobium sp. 9]